MALTRLHVQTQSTECGLAAMGMILGFHGRHVSMATLRAVSGVSRDCVNAADLIRVADHFGLKSRVLKREPDQLSGIGVPFVVYTDFIHFSVVEAIDAEDVLLNDPAFGRYRMPRDRFDDAFTGIALAFEKSAAFQPGGHHVHLWRSLARQLTFCPRFLPLVAIAAGLFQYVFLIAAVLLVGLTPPYGAPPQWAVIVALFFFAVFMIGGAFARTKLEDYFIRKRLPGLAHHALTQPFAFTAYRLPPILTQRILGQEELAQLLFRHFVPAATGVSALFLICTALFLINTFVGVAVSLVAMAGIGLLFLLDRHAAREGREKQDDRDSRWAKISHGLENFESFKTSGADREFFNGAMGINADRLEVRQRTGVARILSEILPDLLVALLLPITLICLWLSLPSAALLAPGAEWTYVAVFGLILALHTPMQALSSLHGGLDRLRLILPPLDDLLDCVPVSQDPRVPDGPVNKSASVLVAHDVSFGFSSVRPPLLSDVNLSIVPGERLGLTGPSGCGKSTLVALLIGLHRPTSGTVSLFGTPLSEIGATRLARDIGWINKNPYFLSGTLRENLELWEPPSTPAALKAAIADACLDDVLTAFPEGLDLRLTPQALNLSGGQRQRVEIARALLRNPQLLVLDEATDGLDRETEQRLFENLRRRGITLIVVSHRATTLDTCDRVLHLRDSSLFDTPKNPASKAIFTTVHEPDPFDMHGVVPERDSECSGRTGEMSDVFRRVAEASGAAPVILPPSPPGTEHWPTQRVIHALARHTSLLVRPVRVAVRAWWKRDHGALIAFLREGNRPVALIPAKAGRCRLYDPRSGLESELPARPETVLMNTGYSIYPRFRGRTPRVRDFFLHATFRLPPALHRVLFSDLLLVLLQGTIPFAAYYLFAELAPFKETSAAVFWLTGLGLYGFALVGIVLLRSLAQNRLEGLLDHSVHSALYQHVMRIRQHFVQDRAKALHRSLQSIPELLRVFRNGTARRLTATLGIATGMSAIAIVSPSAAAWAALLLLPFGLLPLLFLPGVESRTQNWMRARARSREFLRDMFQAAARLQQSGRVKLALAAWTEWTREERAEVEALRRSEDGFDTAGDIVFWATALAFPAAVHPLVGSGPLFLTACFAFFYTSLAARNGVHAVAALVRARPHLQRLEPLAAAPVDPVPPAVSGTGQAPRNPRADTLVTHDLVFSYPGHTHPVLRGGQLAVGSGEIVALAGPPGCGKSSLLRLILGFTVPEQGTISRGNFASCDLSAWRERVGAVLQDDRLEAAQTIHSHIGGTEGFSLTEIREAARLAMLQDDIDAMPMGIQTIVDTERVSTGQKQRILIARRLVRKPELLFLDEATNALSEDMQALLFENLRTLGITCLIVSHRDSVLAAADRVFRIDQGWILETPYAGRTPALLPKTAGE